MADAYKITQDLINIKLGIDSKNINKFKQNTLKSNNNMNVSNLKQVSKDNLKYMFSILASETGLDYYYLPLSSILSSGGNFMTLYWSTYKEFKNLKR